MAETTGSDIPVIEVIEGSQPAVTEAPKAELRILKTLRGFAQFAKGWGYKVPEALPAEIEVRDFATNEILSLETAFVFSMPTRDGKPEPQILSEASARLAERFCAKAVEAGKVEKAEKAQSLATALANFLKFCEKRDSELAEHKDAIQALPLKEIDPLWRTAKDIVDFGSPERVPLVIGETVEHVVKKFHRDFEDYLEELDKLFETEKPRGIDAIGRMVDRFDREWAEAGKPAPFLPVVMIKRFFGERKGFRYVAVATRDNRDILDMLRTMDREVRYGSSVLYWCVLRFCLKAEALAEAEERARLTVYAASETGGKALTAFAAAFQVADVDVLGGALVEKNPGRGRGRKVATGGSFGDGDRPHGRKPRK